MLKWIGFLFIALAAAILGSDVLAAFEGGGFRLSSLGEWWFWVHADSLQLAQPAIERHLHPAIWDPGVQTLLIWPAAVEFALLGAVFIGLWRLRRRRAPA